MKDICNVIQRVVLFIFVAPAKILDWRNAFLVLQQNEMQMCESS